MTETGRMGYLQALQRTWDSIAEDDAFWAILSDPTRKGNKWDYEEFYKTGVREVEVVLDHARSLGVPIDFEGGALDFGCGAGRLTQALSSRFRWAVGVDISAKMIELAEKHNRFPDTCRYVVNGSNSLPFEAGKFSFIYSSIALQHIEPRCVENYIREFLRVLHPQGAAVFQLADQCKSLYFPQWARSVRVRIRRVLEVAGMLKGHMQVLFVGEKSVRTVLDACGGTIKDVQFTNSLLPEFNGNLQYLGGEPKAGFIGKQYCVLKSSRLR